MRGFASLTASLAAVAFFLTCFSGMHSVNGDKAATADLPNSGARLSFQEARNEELNRREMSPRAVSLSHKFVGLGRRSLSDNNADAQQRTAAVDLSEENDEKSEIAGRDSASVPVPEVDDFVDGKRAIPSSLRYTGLGKRRQGVSAAMRYAGLGKRFPESADAPESENDDEVVPAAVKSGDSTQTALAEIDAAAGVQSPHRRKRFAVDLLDDIPSDEYDDEQEDDDDEPFIYSVKRQPATETTIVKPRIGVGMRYVGVGKRKLNVRSRVDAGMRYMGIGKRSRY